MSSPIDVGVTPVERLARRLCKLLPPGQPISRGALETMLEQIDHADRRASTISKIRRRMSYRRDGDIEKAVDLAAVRGWVRITPEACMLTEAGALFARRSRVGVQRRRQFF